MAGQLKSPLLFRQVLPEAAESFWSWGLQCRLPFPNNCYVSAIMQCLFNNPKMTIFDQLTAGHPSHCDIACCMSGKLNNWAVLYAALVTLSHSYRSIMQPCNLSTAIVPSEWCSALVHPILKPNIPGPRTPANYRGIALQSVVFKVLKISHSEVYKPLIHLLERWISTYTPRPQAVLIHR